MAYKFQMDLTRKGKNFRALDTDAQASLVNAQFSNSLDLLRSIRELEPERTGRMKRETVIRRAGPLNYDAVGEAEYTRFQNEGTRFIAGKHFMERGIANVKPRAERRIEDALKKAGLYAG
jgi:hypothetical protein